MNIEICRINDFNINYDIPFCIIYNICRVGLYGCAGVKAEGVVATCVSPLGLKECVVGSADGYITLWKGNPFIV